MLLRAGQFNTTGSFLEPAKRGVPGIDEMVVAAAAPLVNPCGSSMNLIFVE